MSGNGHFRRRGYGFDFRSSRTLVDMMFITSGDESPPPKGQHMKLAASHRNDHKEKSAPWVVIWLTWPILFAFNVGLALLEISWRGNYSSVLTALLITDVVVLVTLEFLFPDVVSIKRRPSYIRAVNDVLNSDHFVTFLDHERYQSLVQQVPGSLYSTIQVILHVFLNKSVTNVR